MLVAASVFAGTSAPLGAEPHANAHTAKSGARAAGTARLLWADSHYDGETGRLWAAPTDGSGATRITGGFEIHCVVADLAAGKLYWSEDPHDSSPGSIIRANLDGSSKGILVDGLGGPWDLELDLAAGKIYWTDHEAGTIGRADLDGSNVGELVTGLQQPEGLALDLEAGTMYFTDPTANTVTRANLDGSSATVIITGYTSAGDVEVDTVNDKVYIVSQNQSPPGLSWADLDGSNLAFLAHMVTTGIEVRGNDLYHVDSQGSVGKMNLDGSNPTQLTPYNTISQETYFDVDVAQAQVYGSGGTFSSAPAHMFRFDLDLVSPNPLLIAHRIGRQLHDAAVDGSTGQVFFADGETHSLFADNLHGPAAELLLTSADDLDDPRGLVLDAAASRIYWLENRDLAIRAVNTDGTGLTELIAGLSTPHDLALDASNGHLYFTDGVSNGSATTAAIRRIDVNGSNLVDIITGLSQGIRGIAVDTAGGKLYWTELVSNTISRADLAGSNQEVILSGLNQPHDVAVDPAGGKLYWTEGIHYDDNPTGMISRANLDGTSPEPVLTGLTSLTRDLSFVFLSNEIFTDGFESGDTTAWSGTVGGP